MICLSVNLLCPILCCFLDPEDFLLQWLNFRKLAQLGRPSYRVPTWARVGSSRRASGCPLYGDQRWNESYLSAHMEDNHE